MTHEMNCWVVVVIQGCQSYGNLCLKSDDWKSSTLYEKVIRGPLKWSQNPTEYLMDKKEYLCPLRWILGFVLNVLSQRPSELAYKSIFLHTSTVPYEARDTKIKESINQTDSYSISRTHILSIQSSYILEDSDFCKRKKPLTAKSYFFHS